MSSTRTEFLAKDRRRRPDSENVEFNTIVPAKVRFCYTGAGSASSCGREPPADGDRAPDSFLFQKWLFTGQNRISVDYVKSVADRRQYSLKDGVFTDRYTINSRGFRGPEMSAHDSRPVICIL